MPANAEYSGFAEGRRQIPNIVGFAGENRQIPNILVRIPVFLSNAEWDKCSTTKTHYFSELNFLIKVSKFQQYFWWQTMLIHLLQQAKDLWHLLLHNRFSFLHLHLRVVQSVLQSHRSNPCPPPIDSLVATSLTLTSLSCGTSSKLKNPLSVHNWNIDLRYRVIKTIFFAVLGVISLLWCHSKFVDFLKIGHNIVILLTTKIIWHGRVFLRNDLRQMGFEFVGKICLFGSGFLLLAAFLSVTKDDRIKTKWDENLR